MYLADDKPLEIEGKGDVSVKLASGDVFKLKDVKFISNLKKNLISLVNLTSPATR